MMTNKPTKSLMQTIVMAQVELAVGDLPFNRQKILAVLARQPSHSLVVFPELTICGYCCQDLLLRQEFIEDCQQSLDLILKQAPHNSFVLGLPKYIDGELYNLLVVIEQGQIVAEYRKQHLPTYEIYDEARYFKAGFQPGRVEIMGRTLGLLICEDIWRPSCVDALAALSPIDLALDLVLVINASPFEQDKRQTRQQLLHRASTTLGCPVCYVNLTGAQDELVFDGRSLWVDAHQQISWHLPMCLESVVRVDWQQPKPIPVSNITLTDSAGSDPFNHRLVQLNRYLINEENSDGENSDEDRPCQLLHCFAEGFKELH